MRDRAPSALGFRVLGPTWISRARHPPPLPRGGSDHLNIFPRTKRGPTTSGLGRPPGWQALPPLTEPPRRPKSHSSSAVAPGRRPCCNPPASARAAGVPSARGRGAAMTTELVRGSRSPVLRARARRSRDSRDHVGPGAPAMQVTAYFA